MDLDPTSAFLSQVERGLAEAVRLSSSDANVMVAAASHLCLAGGAKRMRPRLVALLAQALGVEEAAAADVAISAELIHAASLLHDDVVDQGQTRRGRATVNATWGNPVAVLTGDWLLCGAISRLSRHPKPVVSSSVECVAQMSRAAILELQARGDLSIGEAGWREIALGKTGALLGWCGEALAQISGRAELLAPLGAFGRHLGVAFQLADDLADMTSAETGKDPFSDLRNRNPSLPVILAAGADADLRSRIAAAWAWPSVSPASARALGEEVRAAASTLECAHRLERELEDAGAALGNLRQAIWEPLQDWAAPLTGSVPHSARGAPLAPQRGDP